MAARARQAEVVDLSDAYTVEDEEGTIAYRDDGSIELSDGSSEGKPKSNPADHNANLAEHLDDSERAEIAERLIEAYEHDKKAREPWERRLARGMEIVGLTPAPEGSEPFQGASTVVYPIIAEATIQFNARAMDEIFPAAGPVKTVVVGDKTAEREQQSQRVEQYMNYQITEEDPGWQDEDDRLLIRLPLDGHSWKKTYRDERLAIQTSKFVSGHDVFAPYNATAMHSLPRLCQRYYATANDVRFEQLSGNWLNIDLAEPPPHSAEDQSEVQERIDEAEGTTPEAEGQAEIDRSGSREILEFYVDYDLSNFEHVGDETNEPTGFALPYIMTVDYSSRQVLKIVRNWREGDELFRKRINLVPYRFLPGLGFYGFGFLHWIGSLNEAATGALRALLDSAAFNNMQGGFASSDLIAKTGAQSLSITMGEWKSINASAEDLRNGLYTPPWHPPAEALFKLLGMLVEAGKSFTSTTEAMTGSASSTGPVGTMVALIEQGSKVFSGIHKRLHKSKRDEYRLLAELNGEHIPEEGYPYDVGGEGREVFAQDFGPEVDVLPVSDPNIFSAQQRIAIAQALLELAQTNPELYDVQEAHRRMLEALKVPAIDDVLLDRSDRPRQDPVTENQMLLSGQPIQAFPDQNHRAHMQVHQAFMQHPGFGGQEQAAEAIQATMLAHLGEHLGFLYKQTMMQIAGIQPPATGGEGADEDEEAELDPQTEEQIAMQAAAATDQFLQAQGMPQMPDPQAEAEAAQAQQEAMEAQAEMERKQAEWQAEQERKQAEWMAEQERKMAEWLADQQREAEEHEAQMERDEEKAEAQRKQAEQQAKERQSQNGGSED